jgi:opacity protein-like surface antigen
MKTFSNFLTASAVAVAMMAGASSANAAVSLDLINSADLNLNGTEGFGATITDTLGAFEHTFTFTLDGSNLTNTTVGTVQLGSKDIDFSEITLDGFNLTQVGLGDPSGENWELLGTVLGAGPHTITVKGSVIGFGTTPGATYTGSLNIAAVPEPATWALMIMGFGSAGYMIRRRRVAFA